MVSITELSVWLFIGIIQFVSMIFSFRGWIKSKMIHFFLLFLTNFSAMLYGFFYFVGRYLQNVTFIVFGFVAINLVIFFHFFTHQKLFGKIRNYAYMQYALIILITGSIYSVIISPPILIDSNMIFPNIEKIFMMGAFFFFLFITFDFIIFSIKKILRENHSKNLLYYPLTLLFSGIGTFIIYCLVIFNLSPLYLAMTPAIIGLCGQTYFLIKNPKSLFLVPIDPIYFAVVSKNGKTLYSETIKQKIPSELINTSLQTINIIFQNSIHDEKKPEFHLKQLEFTNLVCYFEYCSDFFIILIDRIYSEYVQASLKTLLNELKQSIPSKFINWDGDLEEFVYLKKKFRDIFWYVPGL